MEQQHTRHPGQEEAAVIIIVVCLDAFSSH